MFSSPHRCKRPPPLLNTDKELSRIRPRTMQADATISACSIPAISSAQHASIPFILFDFFDFLTFRPQSLIPYLQLILLFDSNHLSPPAMYYPILRSHYSQVVVATVAVAESQGVSYAPIPVLCSSNSWPTK